MSSLDILDRSAFALSARSRAPAEKNFLKKPLKPLDNSFRMWYTETRAGEEPKKKLKIFFEKPLKLLDKFPDLWYTKTRIQRKEKPMSKSKKLTADQLRQVANTAGVDPAALKAVAMVESSGTGFIRCRLPDGKYLLRPVILLERHLVWRRLETRGIDPRPLYDDHPSLCGAFWNPKRFPYGPRQKQWEKVQTIVDWAAKLDPRRVESYRKSAWEACSWGMFQLLGMNYRAAGFPDVDAFAAAHSESEARQLEAAVRWMENCGLLSRLQRLDWAAFARGYNGPGQVNLYASRLEAAYNQARMQSAGGK